MLAGSAVNNNQYDNKTKGKLKIRILNDESLTKTKTLVSTNKYSSIICNHHGSNPLRIQSESYHNRNRINRTLTFSKVRKQ